jgi:hypothetical protein
MQSNPITIRTTYRQANEPTKKIDGMEWINPAGGANGNNSETYIWNQDSQSWELVRSVGPDTPLYPATGANWRDTANGQTKTYDDATWVNVGVTDHANLTNVKPPQHAPSQGSLNTTTTSHNSTTGEFMTVDGGNLATVINGVVTYDVGISELSYHDGNGFIYTVYDYDQYANNGTRPTSLQLPPFAGVENVYVTGESTNGVLTMKVGYQ